MALLKHHIFDQVTAWLGGRAGRTDIPAALQGLRAAPLLTSDASSLAAAISVYGGDTVISAPDFQSLVWLESFARSGRHLLVCHAMKLLEAWAAKRRRAGSLAEEIAILNRLSLSAGQCANLLPADQLRLHGQALTAQIQRVIALKALSAADIRDKALALLQAASVLQSGESVKAEARVLLDQALPLLIASDGGPAEDDLLSHITMVQDFLARPDLSLGDAARHALDRARPFLAMLIGPQWEYCLETAPRPDAQVLQTASLRHAPQSHVARLAAGKTIAIGLPLQGQSSASLVLFSGTHQLCKAGLFLHAPDDDVQTLSMVGDQTDDGQWLRHTTALQQRTLFMTASGDDLRIEDQITPTGRPAWMQLALEEQAKVSVSRSGTQATIALDGRTVWQLALRGGTLLSADGDGQWLVKTSGTCVNWSLKRVTTTRTKHQRESLPELPF